MKLDKDSGEASKWIDLDATENQQWACVCLTPSPILGTFMTVPKRTTLSPSCMPTWNGADPEHPCIWRKVPGPYLNCRSAPESELASVDCTERAGPLGKFMVLLVPLHHTPKPQWL